MNKKVMVAMSGGVDSAVTAYLIKSQGYDAVAATIRLGSFCSGDSNFCISDTDLADAEHMAESFGMKHYTVDLTEQFRKAVVDRFVDTYISGETPNPCVECNRYIKFGELLDFGIGRLGADRIATGHYASVAHDAGGRYLLGKARDLSKDQTYVLWRLTQEQLSRTIFPLASYTKAEIRELASGLGITAAHKKDSQDICFIPDGNYAAFIERFTGRFFPDGNFIGTDGTVLGCHRGIINYTIGQRKGLGLAFGEPMYVGSKSASDNTVTLCRNEELFTRKVFLKQINLISCDTIPSHIRATAKLRYSHLESAAIVTQTDDDSLLLEFDTPQRAVTPGQSAVIYDGCTVVGGGIIQAEPDR